MICIHKLVNIFRKTKLTLRDRRPLIYIYGNVIYHKKKVCHDDLIKTSCTQSINALSVVTFNSTARSLANNHKIQFQVQ